MKQIETKAPKWAWLNLQPPLIMSQKTELPNWGQTSHGGRHRQCQGAPITSRSGLFCAIITFSSLNPKHKQNTAPTAVLPMQRHRQWSNSTPGPQEITQGNRQESGLTDLNITSEGVGTGFTHHQYQHNSYSARQSPQKWPPESLWGL